jgi:hypothetical protein
MTLLNDVTVKKYFKKQLFLKVIASVPSRCRKHYEFVIINK